MFPDDPGHVRLANPNEELRSRCILLQRKSATRVTQVTGDLGMQLRTDAHGLDRTEIPDNKYAKYAKRRAAAADD